MAKIRLPVWPAQVPQPDDFTIIELDSTFKAHYVVDNYTQKFRRQWAGSATTSASQVAACSSKILSSRDGAGANYSTALQRWRDVLERLHLSEREKIRMADLTPAECKSYELLREWWDNDTYDANVTRCIRDWIEQAAHLLLNVDICPRLVTSRYNFVLFTLWRAEFCHDTSTDSTNRQERMRLMSAPEAACHRLASNAMTKLQRSWILEPQDESQHFPAITHPAPEALNYVDPPMTAGFQPCSWLAHDVDGTGWPYYLWDRIERRTVITHRLESPHYIVISHTWGRWRKIPFSDVPVPGVPWPVPENTLFNVISLPSLLARVPFAARYIWFDLFCIPQNMSDPNFEARAKTEIANQGTIFKRAFLACAWFNWIPSWDGLRNAIEWLSLVYVDCNEPSAFRLQEARDKAKLRAEEPTSLLYPHQSAAEGRADVTDSQPSGWFTSLWTLQEVCLRPDMLLCDRNWRALTVGRHFHVSLDHIIALWTSVHEAIATQQTVWPRSAYEICRLLAETGMGELPRISPLTVLMLGNQRYCEDRRAEAIMSVIGAKDWFVHNAGPGNSQPLVLGRYPFSFVEEVRQKLKGSFFASADLVFEEVNESGTLLPFSDKSVGHRRIAVDPSHAEDHPSVATWKLCPDGTVVLPEAGIMAAYPRRLEKNEMARVLVPKGTPDVPQCPTEDIELTDFLASFLTDQEKYAVCLLAAGSRINGFILLREKRADGLSFCSSPSSSHSLKRFRKIAVFFFNCDDDDHKRLREGGTYQLPRSVRTNWVVL